ncbi:hypothetical protein E1267_29245 [Nonomuraea longispora]|uniref:Uncharacterized protein n=1 Tax=Nonomuraea longispora TaxID=1848320 RepID=A0A4R4N1C9_9ACTN|nr:hypothetical protein [Nonomuraea longispora]TDC02459.1 hypothetical protein E1267_29245 [Nonomuraea longispora]
MSHLVAAFAGVRDCPDSAGPRPPPSGVEEHSRRRGNRTSHQGDHDARGMQAAGLGFLMSHHTRRGGENEERVADQMPDAQRRRRGAEASARGPGAGADHLTDRRAEGQEHGAGQHGPAGAVPSASSSTTTLASAATTAAPTATVAGRPGD